MPHVLVEQQCLDVPRTFLRRLRALRMLAAASGTAFRVFHSNWKQSWKSRMDAAPVMCTQRSIVNQMYLWDS